MNYLAIDTLDANHKEHLRSLVNFLREEVLSAGGDGDALWYSRYFDVEDIKKLVEESNSKQKFPWEIKFEDKTLHWGTNQEWVCITNDEHLYHNAPDWTQFKLQY